MANAIIKDTSKVYFHFVVVKSSLSSIITIMASFVARRTALGASWASTSRMIQQGAPRWYASKARSNGAEAKQDHKIDYDRVVALRNKYMSPSLATFCAYDKPLVLSKGSMQYMFVSLTSSNVSPSRFAE